MKVDVQANDFCPDDCPFCDPNKKLFAAGYHNGEPYAFSYCENKDICAYAVKCYKEQERRESGVCKESEVQDNERK